MISIPWHACVGTQLEPAILKRLQRAIRRHHAPSPLEPTARLPDPTPARPPRISAVPPPQGTVVVGERGGRSGARATLTDKAGRRLTRTRSVCLVRTPTQTHNRRPMHPTPRTASSSSAAAAQIAATAAAAADASAASLAELALSAQPLTSSTSLLQLLAPDVQSYILKHARGPSAGSSSGGGGAAPTAFNGASAMRIATTVPGGGADVPPAPAPAFGRRKQRASTASIASASQSPPRHSPPSSSYSLSRGRRRTPIDPLVGPVAALANSYLDAAHIQQNWKSAEAMPAPHTNLGPTAAAIQAALHAHANSPRGQAAAAAAASAATANGTATTALYEGGPRLFNSQSKDLLLAGMDGAQSARGAAASEDGLLHPPIAASARSHHKHSLGNPRSYNGLNGLSYSLTSPTASQSSLFSSGAHSSSSHAVHLASSSSLVEGGQKFLLPQHNVLDINDGWTGAVDRWPAGYSDRKSNQAAKAALSGVGGSGGGSSGGGGGAAGSAQALREYEESLLGSKPSLLQDLESFISGELRSQGLVDRDPPSLARLGVYREALMKFAAGFNTYRTLLGRIQREYDEFLREQDRALSKLPELQRQLATMEAKVGEQREIERKAQERKDVQTAAEASKLRAEIERITEEKSRALAESNERRKELAAVSAQLHSLNESHVTLKSALARASAERASALESWMSEAELARRLGVRVADQQKQQEALLHELSLLRSHASAQAAATPAHLQPVLDELASTKSSLALVESRLQSRSSEYFTLLNLYESLVAERATMVEERTKYEELKRSSTPRPAWRRLLAQQYLPPTASLEIQSSESLLDELCTEIDRLRASLHAWELKYPNADEVAELELKLKDDGVKKAAAPLLVVRGSGPDVPLFLRTGKPGGKIRNKNISKRDVEILIKECWSMKLQTPDSQGGAEFRAMSLETFLYTFLKTKFGFHEAITAYGYSLLDALDRFRFDGDCELFLSILGGQLSEAVYLDQFSMLDALRQKLQDADVAYHKGRIKGRLPRKILLEALTRFFSPAKPEANIKKINHALFISDRGETVAYPALFQEDREGNQSPFLECIRDQHLSEISEFMELIQSKLKDKAKRYPEAQGLLRISQIREVLTMCDPAKSATEIDMYLRAGRGLPINQTSVNAQIAQEKMAADAAANAAAAAAGKSAAPAAAASAASPSKPASNPEDDGLLIDPEVFFKNLSRLLIKRTGPPPVDHSAELNRRGSLVYAGSIGISGPGTRAGLTSPASLDLPQRRTSTSGASGASTPGSDGGGGDEEEKRGPASSSRRPALTRGGSIVDASASTPTKQQQQPQQPPLSGRTPFSPLAKRLSMVGAPGMNLANVVLAARQQSLLQNAAAGGAASPNQTPVAAATTATTATPGTAPAQTTQPSSPASVLAPPALNVASPAAATSASARAAASAASLDRLTTFVLARAERQREEALAEELATAAARGDAGPRNGLSSSASIAQLGPAGARPQAQVLQLQREGENFAAERAEIEIERQASLGSAGGEGDRTPEEVDTPRLSTPPDQLTSLLHRAAAMHTPAATTTQPQQQGSAQGNSSKSPRAGVSTGTGAAASASVGEGSLTGADSAGSIAATAASASSRSPGNRPSVGFINPRAPPQQQQASDTSSGSEFVVSPVFSPVSTSVIQTRKQLRQSLRKSGGLAILLARQKLEDPSAADPDLDIVSRTHTREQSL